MSFIDNRAVYTAVPALVWSSFIYLVQSIGIIKVYVVVPFTLSSHPIRTKNIVYRFRHYSYPLRKPVSPYLSEDQVPHITIIRPVKGLEPELYDCLASTFRQTYPKSKLSINLCVSSEDDPSYPVLEKVVEDFSGDFDVRLLVEEYDPLISSLEGKTGNELGPNPKIRNISRAYREAKGDIIWIVDCNIWISKGTTGRMVDKLMGYLPNGQRTTPFRFVHQMPLEVDIPPPTASVKDESLASRVLRLGGGRLDEMFMATTHAKFYGAINTVSIAPCIIGKSNMFRKSHLDTYTDPANNKTLSPSDANRGRGIDFFSGYICEDHLIGDLLWNANIPGFKHHGLVWGDLAIQPMAAMSVTAYCARRVRWLRARKFTVLLATLIEPGVESLLCNFCFAYAATTLPFFNSTFSIPQTWSATGLLWLMGVSIWMGCDRVVFGKLHKGLTIEVDKDTPAFARGAGQPGGVPKRPFKEWLPSWIARELLALPIWTWAVFFGTTVTWRGKSFQVHRDMSVVALDADKNSKQNVQVDVLANETQNGHADYKHPEIQDTPQWEGRPTARHRKSHPKV